MGLLESQSKLMYYPTHKKEIYRILGVVGRITLPVNKRDKLRDVIGNDKYNIISEKALGKNNFRPELFLFDYLVKNEMYETIHKCFNIAFGFSQKDQYTIFDPFAGEGGWLESFKKFIPNEQIGSADLYLIGNELENNRFKTIDNNDNIDEAYNEAFENLKDIPKNSISLLLYNPPYGDTNGVRNVKHYLKMIIDRKIIHNSKDTHGSNNGSIVMVIRRDDLLDSLPLLATHFNVHKKHLYKTHNKEYEKYKQYVVYATLRNDPLDEKNSNDALKIQEEVSSIEEIVNSEPKYNNDMHRLLIYELPSIPYQKIKKDHVIEKDEKYIISDVTNDNWKWLKENTEVKEVSNDTINKPTDLKVGEMANIIASGMINGEMSNNGIGKHIVAGGTKNQIKEEYYQEEDKNGKKQDMIKTTHYTVPYLNILVKDSDGIIKIKELSGESELL